MLGALLLAGPGRAQDAAPPGLDAVFVQGTQALDAGRIDEAIDVLEGVFEEDPAYTATGRGSGAYWLGRAYEADDDPESVREVWKEGLEALVEARRYDPRLADAFARMTFAQRYDADYGLAARAYLYLLESLDWYPYLDDEADLARAHLDALAIILPEDLQQKTGLDRLERDGLDALAEGAGARLVAWWRSRDVAPATRNNERLEEHLSRVLYAEEHYQHRGSFDDRARVYIQLGAPSHSTTVPFDNVSFRTKVVDRSLTLHMSDFPENEFWVYEHVDQAAQFLFYSDGGPYQLGEVRDLLPSALRNGLGSSDRGKSKARALVYTLDEVYRQLSLFHPNFATIYQEVASFAGLLDEAQYVAEAKAQRQTNEQAIDQEGGDDGLPEEVRNALANSGSGLTASMPGATYNPDRPDLFAQSILSKAHIEDEQALLQRQDYVPRTYTNTFDEAEPLPTVARWARFLDDDGATRTEIYWGVPTGAMQPSKRMLGAIQKEGFAAKDYLLLMTVVQQNAAYQERVVNYNRILIPDLADAADASLAPQVYVARGDTGLYHLAVQWDQYVTTLDARGQPETMGLRLKANTYRADSLQALNNDERILEMSDLKPMILLDAAGAAQADDVLDTAALYPFDTLEKQTPLVLYFEIYHLAYGTDDQTQYTVAYEVRRTGGGGLLRFLGRPDEEGAAAETDYTGSSRTAQESILLDFAQWDGRGAVDITVRVTDRVTRRQVERVIPMTLVKER